MFESDRIKQLPPYVFNLIDDLKKEVIATGANLIDFGMGNPDMPTPGHIIDAMIQATKEPDSSRYGPSKGISELRQAISKWYERRFDVSINPTSETIVTIGSKEGLSHLALAMTGPNDRVLVPTPAYPIHHYGFVLAGASVTHVPLSLDEEVFFSSIKTAIETKPTPKVLLVNFPSNPTCQMVSLGFFESLVSLCKKHEVFIIHDFAYADIVFDGKKASSLLEVPGAKDIAVETFTLSKSYNMPGWRVGFVSGNADIIKALGRVKSYLDYGLFSPIQQGAISALNGAPSVTEDICKRYEKRRDVLHQGLNDIGWVVSKPLATMFLWAQIPKLYQDLDSLSFTKYLLENTSVALSPGIGFGDGGEGFVRFSLIEEDDRVYDALSRLDKLFKKDRALDGDKPPLVATG